MAKCYACGKEICYSNETGTIYDIKNGIPIEHRCKELEPRKDKPHGQMPRQKRTGNATI